MDYQIEVVSTVASPTAVIAAATTWNDFPALWPRLLDDVFAFLGAPAAASQGVKQAGQVVMLYKDDEPNVEVGVQVNGPFAPEGDVVSSELPAGEAVHTVHRGSPLTIREAYEAIAAWCSTAGRPRAVRRWEIYGDHTENDADFETEVYWLLA